DIIQEFLPYFADSKQEHAKKNRKIAAVQGYQWHFLNKSQNWITRGVRCEFAGSYVVERTANQRFGLMKQISGSVTMIKFNILKRYGWPTSLTEDWALTLKLYEEGYKVVYAPTIQVPAECPSTLSSIVRQRMRWSEGHTFNVRKHFREFLSSKKISPLEKIEFTYLSTYYLQSIFFLIGTISWLTGSFMGSALPFWTNAAGFGILFFNLMSLPLMNISGLLVENTLSRDIRGVFSSFALTFVLAPYQAYASFKGLLEAQEGRWFRTLKTGKITDLIERIRSKGMRSELTEEQVDDEVSETETDSFSSTKEYYLEHAMKKLNDGDAKYARKFLGRARALPKAEKAPTIDK
ncbi:glycosyltransferase family 2 protein, partial [Candidatus Pacearchaeota archaeon]|nr:glycosyltransferase family 2 protein [Candidatus Pacearchaeota archaeon]